MNRRIQATETPSLLSKFHWAASRHHEREKRRLMEEQDGLKLQLRIARKAVGLTFVIALMAMVVCAQPPLPQGAAMQNLGRQNPYLSTSTALVTQTVTSVYQVKFLRSVEITTNSMETNFVTLRSNLVAVTTNTSIAKPE